MPVSITNNNSFFSNNKSVSFIFKDFDNQGQATVKKEGDFCLLIFNKKVVGINVKNYEKYFKIKTGFHQIDQNTKQYLIKKFNHYLNEEDFDPFYKIGQVTKISNHPNSNKLKLLEVIFKNNEKKQIITNLQTLKENENYLFATNGSITYEGSKIINTKVANVESQGMIMSYKSLGINKEGIVDCSKLSINDEYDF